MLWGIEGSGFLSNYTCNNLPLYCPRYVWQCHVAFPSFAKMDAFARPWTSHNVLASCPKHSWETVHNIQQVSQVHSEHGRPIFPVNSCSLAVEKRGLGVRSDRTAQPLMFLQNYLVDKCSIINLNPLAKRIHKYLNNGLFRVLPVYQTCHMSTFYIFLTAEKKKAGRNLMDGF